MYSVYNHAVVSLYIVKQMYIQGFQKTVQNEALHIRMFLYRKHSAYIKFYSTKHICFLLYHIVNETHCRDVAI